MGRGAWRATVHRVTKEPDTTEHAAHAHIDPSPVPPTPFSLEEGMAPFPLWYPHICSTWVYFCLANKIIHPCF